MGLTGLMMWAVCVHACKALTLLSLWGAIWLWDTVSEDIFGTWGHLVWVPFEGWGQFLWLRLALRSGSAEGKPNSSPAVPRWWNEWPNLIQLAESLPVFYLSVLLWLRLKGTGPYMLAHASQRISSERFKVKASPSSTASWIALHLYVYQMNKRNVCGTQLWRLGVRECMMSVLTHIEVHTCVCFT